MENEDIKLTPIEDDNEEQMNTAVTETYDASQIQVLEGLEAVRKRPGMYIGSTGPKGLHHLVYEIVDNSVDEALAGYCTHIEVEILPGDIITVRDNGRGIPVDINEQQGLPAVTVVAPSAAVTVTVVLGMSVPVMVSRSTSAAAVGRLPASVS